MEKVVIDSNIILRLLIEDHLDHLIISRNIFKKIREKKLFAYLSIAVVNEVLWISKTYYNIPRDIFIPQFLKLVELQNMIVIEVEKYKLLHVLSIMCNTKFDFTDIYLSVIADNKEILSFDKDFEKLKILTS